MSNRLIQRVRRHQNIARIFRSADTTSQPQEGGSISTRGRMGIQPALVVGQLLTAPTTAELAADAAIAAPQPSIIQPMTQEPVSSALQQSVVSLTGPTAQPVPVQTGTAQQPISQQPIQPIQPAPIDSPATPAFSAIASSQAETPVSEEMQSVANATPPQARIPAAVVQTSSQIASPSVSPTAEETESDGGREPEAAQSEDDRLWNRLQRIRQAHETQELGDAAPVQRTQTPAQTASPNVEPVPDSPVPDSPASDSLSRSRSEESGDISLQVDAESPDQIADAQARQPEYVESDRPSLDQVWPVQRRSTEESPDNADAEIRASSPVQRDSSTQPELDSANPEVSETVQTMLENVAPSRDTESAIHVVAPRRPRPAHLQARRTPQDVTPSPLSQQDQAEPEVPAEGSLSDMSAADENLDSVQMQQAPYDAQPAPDIATDISTGIQELKAQTAPDASSLIGGPSVTDEPIELVSTPNQPASTPLQQENTNAPSIQRFTEGTADQTADDSPTIQTEIGELPSDLWTLIDEPIPEQREQEPLQPESPAIDLQNHPDALPGSPDSTHGNPPVAAQLGGQNQIQPKSEVSATLPATETIQRVPDQSVPPAQVNADKAEQTEEFPLSQASSVHEQPISVAPGFDDATNTEEPNQSNFQPPLATPLNNEPTESEARIQRSEDLASDGPPSETNEPLSRQLEAEPYAEPTSPSLATNVVAQLNDEPSATITPSSSVQNPNRAIDETGIQNQPDSEYHPAIPEFSQDLSSEETTPAQDIIQEALVEAASSPQELRSAIDAPDPTVIDNVDNANLENDNFENANKNGSYSGIDDSPPYPQPADEPGIETNRSLNGETAAPLQRSIQHQTVQDYQTNMEAHEARTQKTSSEASSNGSNHTHAPVQRQPVDVAIAVMRAALDDEEMPLDDPATEMSDRLADPGVTGAPVDAESTSEENDAKERDDDEEISELARQVYAFLQRKLAVERERMN